MNLLQVCKLSLPMLAAMLLSQAVYGQSSFSAVPVRPPSNVPAGYTGPVVWLVTSTGPFVHGPGQTVTTCLDSGCYYYPADVRTAYATGSILNGGGAGVTVGIVDAFYNPQTAADLAAFDTEFDLPACTAANGCLTIVNQTGGAPDAGLDSGWALETDLDVQWVHAMAPNAKILLVTAINDSSVNMYTAEQYAMANSNVVSNSWGGAEYSGETSSDSVFSASTVPLLFSAGDTGATLEYPCTSPYVTCVGGTRLLETATSFRSLESAWGGAANDGGTGGGCSVYESEPTYEDGYSNSVCGSARGVPDVAGIADPATAVLAYLGSNVCGGYGSESDEPTCTADNFYEIGGTSVASPVTAGFIADVDSARLAASKSVLGSNLNLYLYEAAGAPLYHYRYWDITTGSSGFPAVAGWDRATGLGVPLEPVLGAFLVTVP